MKKLFLKRHKDLNQKTKSVSVIQKTIDTDSITHITKNFVYLVTKSDKLVPEIEPPQIYITKEFDTKRKIEMFNFQVKGHFYITQDRALIKIYFHHTLNIKIKWKTKNFSPKKSAIMAE